MSSVGDVFEPTRVEHIRDIMTTFYGQCEVGDKMSVGIQGDHLFPSEYSENRPEGVITRVMSTAAGDRSDAIRVHFDSGEKKTFSLSSLDPQGIWEFTPESFEGVLARSVQRAEAEYRSSAVDENVDENVDGADPSGDVSEAEAPQYRGLDTLGEEVDQLRHMLEQYIESQQVDEAKFRGCVVETVAKIAHDVVKQESTFCNVLNTEYRGVADDNSSVSSGGAEDQLINSDFTDSSDDDVE
jgi:hypothetical protein